MTDRRNTVLALVAGLAPDRGAPVSVDSDLIDDLGYDSPRKLELTVSIERSLGMALPAPEHTIDTVAVLLSWIEEAIAEKEAAKAGADARA